MRQPISNQCAVAVALAAKILQLNYFFPATLPIVHFVTCALLINTTAKANDTTDILQTFR